MHMPLSADWQVETVGGYSEERYEALPLAYRQDVASLEASAADRARRRAEGEVIPPQEMDAAGGRENALELPVDIQERIEEISSRVAALIAEYLETQRPELLLAARQQLIAVELVTESADAAAAEKFLGGAVRGLLWKVSTSVKELLLNGVRHGHTGDVRKKVEARYRLPAEVGRLDLEVEDTGHGFKRAELADMLTMLESNHGRGLMYVDEFLSEPEYRNGGRLAVTHCEVRDRFAASLAGYTRKDALEILEKAEESAG
jgi:anti-sigma regulatory factor (Ser/Thr protein kinase)